MASTRRMIAGLSVLAWLAIGDAGSRGADAPEGTVEFEGRRYKLVDEVQDLSWSKARAQCVALGGDLVVIGSEAESAFVTKLCDGRYMFLGASDEAEEGRWTWVDGSAWGFTNWMDGQPNDYGGHEDYLATYDRGKWVDVEGEGSDFWMPTGFICEWAATPPPATP